MLVREVRAGAQARKPMSIQVVGAPASMAVAESTLKLSEMLVRTGSKITRNYKQGLHNFTVTEISASNMMRSSASEEISFACMKFTPVTLQVGSNSTIRVRLERAYYLRNPLLLTSSGTAIGSVIRNQLGSHCFSTEQNLLDRTYKKSANA